MNFIHVLNKIVHITETAVPVVTLINPAIGIILGSVITMIITVQGQMPDASGAEKKKTVMEQANIRAMVNNVTLDQTHLSHLVDGFVAVLKSDPATTPVNLGKQ